MTCLDCTRRAKLAEASDPTIIVAAFAEVLHREHAKRRLAERDMESAHAEGLHDAAPREFCPGCR